MTSVSLCIDSANGADLKRQEEAWLWRAVYDENVAKGAVSPSHSAKGYFATRHNGAGTGGYNKPGIAEGETVPFRYTCLWIRIVY